MILIDLAADGQLPQLKIRQKLLEIHDQRDRLTERLGSTNDELTYGDRLAEACLALLSRPQQLDRQCVTQARPDTREPPLERGSVLSSPC